MFIFIAHTLRGIDGFADLNICIQLWNLAIGKEKEK